MNQPVQKQKFTDAPTSLTLKQLAGYKAMLENATACEDEKIKTINHSLKSTSERQADFLDQSANNIEHELLNRQLALSNARKVNIRSALLRLKNNDYGYCVTCDDLINPQRLAFDPAIENCIVCSELHDTKNRHHRN